MKQQGRSSAGGWIGAILVAVAFLVFVAEASPKTPNSPAPVIQAPPPGPDTGQNSSLTMERLRKLARSAHGDWNAVSESDQRLMNGLTGGHGRSMFQMMAQDQNSGHNAPPQRQRRDRS